MSKRAELANTYHERGYSCAQAVACAFSDGIGLPEEQIATLLSGFGGGFRQSPLRAGSYNAARSKPYRSRT